MNIGIISQLVPGLVHGLERGVQLELEGSKLLVYAFKHNDKALLQELMAALEKQVEEGLDGATGLVKGNVIQSLLTGSDPFAGSRHMLQDAETKHGVTHDAKGAMVLPK